MFIKLISAHGCPTTLITDQGREFCNNLNDHVCQKMGIDHRIASAYHPQTGGHTERFNRTLCNMLAHYVNAAHNDWDEKLPYVLFAYRTARHASTKQTPFYLVYGRMPRLPIELDIPSSQVPEGENFEENLKIRCDSFLQLSVKREQASVDIKSAQHKQKKYHDATIDACVFKVGDNVLLHNTRMTTRKGGKLESKWKGPYTVTKVNAKGTYYLEGFKTAVNGSRLAMYRTEEEEDVSSERHLAEGLDNKREPLDVPAKEPCVAKKLNQRQCQETVEPNAGKMQNQNECQLPLKKRKVGNIDCFVIDEDEGPATFHFSPVGKSWQQTTSSIFHGTLKNAYQTGSERYVSLHARPIKTVAMRGDGNCLFRTLSYIVFGVQNFHSVVRDTLVSFMKENQNIMRHATREPVKQYLQSSKMETDETWGTEVEIFAFATITTTTVYVYSMYGKERKWLEYKPLSGNPTSRKAVFIENTSDHFVPVLDVEGEEYSRPPYKRIGDFIPETHHKYVSGDLLNAALVNSYRDEQLLMQREKNITTVYVKQFTDVRNTVEGLGSLARDVDPNIFNIICDWGEVENLLN